MKRRDTPRPYVRIDNDLGADDKLLEVAPELFLQACGLHVLAIGLSDRKRTDGFVAKSAFRLLAPDVPEVVVEELVRVGLWKRRKDGYTIHAYLDWQKSRAEIEELSAKRSAAAKASWPREQEDSKPPATCSAPCKADTDTPSNTPSPSDTENDKGLSLQTGQGREPVETHGLPDHLVGYWTDKAGRELNPADVRSLKIMSRDFSSQALCAAIGQAVQQGDSADNYALITTIARGDRS
jgi:hypothetical protein